MQQNQRDQRYHLFYYMLSSSLLKPGACITNNTTQLQTVPSGANIGSNIPQDLLHLKSRPHQECV